MRQILQCYEPGLCFCEMVKIEALVRKDPKTRRFLDCDYHPSAAQLCGSNPTIAAEAACIIEDLGFDVVDLNCGCPVDKVVKDGSGSGLMKSPDKIGQMISAIVSRVHIPVTVKIRSGWDQNGINAPQITRIAEQAGAVAVTVHGRTRKQGYRGQADWSVIRQCKEASQSILVIGNGDISTPEAAESMFRETGCDGVMVARGMLGRPWLIQDIVRHLASLPIEKRSVFMLRDALFAHFRLIEAYQKDRQALLDMRRVGCWYLRTFSGARLLRSEINHAVDVAEIWKILDSFAWERLDLDVKMVIQEVAP